MEVALIVLGLFIYTWIVYSWGVATGIYKAKVIFEKLIQEHNQKVTLDSLYGRKK
jgi:hypothetical protein